MISRPCFSVFHEEVILQNPNKRLVPIPSGLKIVEQRLQSDSYSSRQEWENEMRSICDAAISGLDNDCLEYKIAIHFRRVFQKLIKDIVPAQLLPWFHKSNSIYLKLEKLLFFSPKFVFDGIDTKDIQPGYAKFIYLELGKRLNLINHSYDITKVIHMLSIYGADIDSQLPKAIIHLEELPQQSISALMTYINERTNETIEMKKNYNIKKRKSPRRP